MKRLFALSLVLASLVFYSSGAFAGIDVTIIDGEVLTEGQMLDEIEASESEHHGDAHSAASKPEKAKESAGLPQLDPTWFPSQIFWILITFVSIFSIFSLKILPNMSGTLENRHNHIQNDLDMAETLKEKTDVARHAYEELLNNANQKSMDLMFKADESLKKKTADTLEKFRDKSQNMIVETEAEILKNKDVAMKDMHEIAAEIASLAANKIVGVSTDVKEASAVIKKIHKKAA